MDTPFTAPQGTAAQDFARITIEKLMTDDGVHFGTTIVSAARMAGAFTFHSFGFPVGDLAPGRPCFSDLANERGPVLESIVVRTLSQLATPRRDVPTPVTIPAGAASYLTFVDSVSLLGESFRAVATSYGLSEVAAGFAAAMAAGLLINTFNEAFDPNLGYTMAVFGFVEGCKTVPPLF